MSVKRVVDTAFWNDSKVADLFSAEDRYFMLYLLTNPHTTQLGIYELSISNAANELGYSKDVVRVLLDRFESKYGLIKYNETTGEVAIKNYLRHSIVKGGKPVMDCLKKEETKVKDRTLLSYVCSNLGNYKDTLNVTVLDFINNINTNDNDNDNDNERIVDESSKVTISQLLNNRDLDEIQPLPFDVDKVWKDTYKVYPKQSYSHSAKIAWLDLFKGIATDNQLNVAKMIVYAIQLYLEDYKKQNPDDETFRYVPRFDTWLKEDCMYWIGVYEEKVRGNV